MTFQDQSYSDPTGAGADVTRSDAAKQAAAEVAGTMKDQGSAVTGTVQESGQRVVAEAKQQLGQLTGQTQDQLRTVLARSQEELVGRASEQTDKAAVNLRQVAEELHALSEGRPDDAARMVGYVRQAADRVDDYASRLDRDGFSGVANDLSGFARRRPGVFLLAAITAGFAAGRLVRGMQAAGQDSASTSPVRPDGQTRSALPAPPAGPKVSFAAPPGGVTDVAGDSITAGLGAEPLTVPPEGAAADPLAVGHRGVAVDPLAGAKQGAIQDPLDEVLPPAYLGGEASGPRPPDEIDGPGGLGER